jgi:DNA invertase Pin-like site-specific DNA recombinase
MASERDFYSQERQDELAQKLDPKYTAKATKGALYKGALISQVYQKYGSKKIMRQNALMALKQHYGAAWKSLGREDKITMMLDRIKKDRAAYEKKYKEKWTPDNARFIEVQHNEYQDNLARGIQEGGFLPPGAHSPTALQRAAAIEGVPVPDTPNQIKAQHQLEGAVGQQDPMAALKNAIPGYNQAVKQMAQVPKDPVPVKSEDSILTDFNRGSGFVTGGLGGMLGAAQEATKDVEYKDEARIGGVPVKEGLYRLATGQVDPQMVSDKVAEGAYEGYVNPGDPALGKNLRLADKRYEEVARMLLGPEASDEAVAELKDKYQGYDIMSEYPNATQLAADVVLGPENLVMGPAGAVFKGLAKLYKATIGEKVAAGVAKAAPKATENIRKFGKYMPEVPSPKASKLGDTVRERLTKLGPATEKANALKPKFALAREQAIVQAEKLAPTYKGSKAALEATLTKRNLLKTAKNEGLIREVPKSRVSVATARRKAFEKSGEAVEEALKKVISAEKHGIGTVEVASAVSPKKVQKIINELSKETGLGYSTIVKKGVDPFKTGKLKTKGTLKEGKVMGTLKEGKTYIIENTLKKTLDDLDVMIKEAKFPKAESLRTSTKVYQKLRKGQQAWRLSVTAARGLTFLMREVPTNFMMASLANKATMANPKILRRGSHFE